MKKPIIWVSGPAGSGKTTLVASYLDARKLPCLWYQIEEGDADIATFFYYMGLAARHVPFRETGKTSTWKRKPLPLLTPEYALGIPTFTRRYFEELYRRVQGVKGSSGQGKIRGKQTPEPSSPRTPESFLIVLDNYQDVPADSGFHEMLVYGLDVVPEGINILILSRKGPPPPFIRLEANKKIHSIGWNDIKLSEDETKEILLSGKGPGFSKEVIEHIHNKTEGWVAGLILIAEYMKSERIDDRLLDRLPPEKIFDYFANEIFDKLDRETREFLLKASFLPHMTVQTAEELTGIASAGHILSALNRNNCFTEKYIGSHPVYRFHPLFGEFLLAKAGEVFVPAGINDLRRAAAGILEKCGEIEDAAALYLKGGDWEGISRVIQKNALSFIAQGKIETLRDWLQSIPNGFTEKAPWLLYWLGVCNLPANPPLSRAYFEEAFSLFESEHDTVGALLSWAGVVETVLLELNDFTQLDRWIEWIDRNGFLYSSFPSPDIGIRITSLMSQALQWRRMGHPDIERWVERVLSFARVTGNLNLRLQAYLAISFYYIWSGDFDKCRVVTGEIGKVARSPDASPLVVIMWKTLEACLSTTSYGVQGQTVQAVSEALDLARNSGVHIWDMMILAQGVYGSLNEGDLSSAGSFLKKMEVFLGSGKSNAVGHYHYLSAWFNLVKCSLSQALSHSTRALELTIESGTPFPEMAACLIAAYVLHREGQLQEASDQMTRALRLAIELKSPFFENRCLLARAYFAFDRGDEAAGVEALRKAMELGRKREYITMAHMWQPSIMSSLCARALKEGIEAVYVRDIIQKLGLIPPLPNPPPRGGREWVEVENWPWPLRIHAFGQFEMINNGRPVIFTGKVQKKPIELLKAILSFGGEEVEVDRLMDALWPEADGDTAAISFRTTLYRLRKLVGCEEAVHLGDGRVTLDPRYCWIDIRALQQTAKRIEYLWKENRGDRLDLIIDLLEKAIGLYKGDFLSGDEKLPWTFASRERLRNKYIHLVGGLGRCYEEKGQLEGVVECYRKALNVDNLQEEFYRRLMLFYEKTGRTAEALRTYEQCRAALQTQLGVGPSAPTEEIYRRLRK